MTTKIASVVVLALVATSFALPLKNTGIDITPGALSDFWSQEIMIGNQPIRIALGYKTDGTIQAGAQLTSTINGRVVPISAALETNAQNTKQIKYQISGALDNTVSGQVSGDLNGALQYIVSAWMPVSGSGELNGIGVALEGDHAKPLAITGGVGVSDKTLQARVGLDSSFKPNSINLEVGANNY